MSREAKTNAMRMLDRQKIHYELLTYDCDKFIDGVHAAEQTGAPLDESFKTLAAVGKSGANYVFVLPVACEIDLKAAARAVGEKSVELLHLKDVLSVTGYIRGGVSPIGMKKKFPTVFHQSAAAHPKIYISGGRQGCTLCLAPEDALRAADAVLADIIKH
ncbi:MAG: Cys-tRNA(Pro) deacylase [Clostridiales bacterium]|nr:MAG: Cys-tRNA(Pro) deacylase [Clostridiales bacterium]